MLHDVLIAVHAAAGTLALAAGVAVVGWRRGFDAYFWSLMVMAASLVGAVAAGWANEQPATNLVFSGLIVLAAFMVLRAVQARGMWRTAPRRPSARFLDAVGCTLISLFDGFVIVAVLTRGGPVWLAVAAGVLGVVAGRAAMHRVQSA